MLRPIKLHLVLFHPKTQLTVHQFVGFLCAAGKCPTRAAAFMQHDGVLWKTFDVTQILWQKLPRRFTTVHLFNNHCIQHRIETAKLT